MALTGIDYRKQMQALLPQGPAWTRAVGALLTKVLDAFGAEFARIDAGARRLIDEADPRTTVDLLTDWERVAGLPDNCSGLLAETQQGRRRDLVSKLVGQGGQTKAYYLEIARALGFIVEIEEFREFRAGGARAGDALTNGDWKYAWRVNSPSVTVQPFRAGHSAAGESLATWGNAGLECRLRHYRPAHTNIIFAYGAAQGVLLLPDGLPLLVPEGIGLLLE